MKTNMIPIRVQMIIRKKNNGELSYVKHDAQIKKAWWGIRVKWRRPGSIQEVQEVFEQGEYDWEKCDLWILIKPQNPRANDIANYQLKHFCSISGSLFQCDFDFGIEKVIDKILE